jgi:hypothetical protein
MTLQTAMRRTCLGEMCNGSGPSYIRHSNALKINSAAKGLVLALSTQINDAKEDWVCKAAVQRSMEMIIERCVKTRQTSYSTYLKGQHALRR